MLQDDAVLHVTSNPVCVCSLWNSWSRHGRPILYVLFGVVIGVLVAANGDGDGHTLVSADVGSSVSMISGTFWCCGRGIEGTRGPCIRGTAGSVCSAGEIPLLCGAGSTAYLNVKGHPFCCSPSFTGCSNLCVDNNRRNTLLMNGNQCNDVAPPGFRTPGRIQYLGIPWDGQLQRYKFGDRVAQLDELPFPRGTSDFTITATITPRRDDGVGFGRFSIILLRRQADVQGPIALYLGFDDLRNSIDFLFGLDIDNNFSEETARGNVVWQANVPVTFTCIRQSRTLLIFSNSTMLSNTTAGGIFNLDASLAFPLEIGPVTLPEDTNNILNALNADVSDLSISDTADIPGMASQVSM